MNYIERLRGEVRAEKARADALESGVHEFWVFVTTNPKFGNRLPVQTDGLPALAALGGERLDWIATGDVARRLSAIVQAGQDAANEVGG